MDWSRTLAGKLTPTVNRLRMLGDSFGANAYDVWLVWVAWSGARRGEGSPSVSREVQILPTPRVASPSAVRYRYEPGGFMPSGDLYLDRIPLPTAEGGCSRSLLLGIDTGALPHNVQFFWELRGRSDKAQVLRYAVAGEPWHDPSGVQWVIALSHITPDSTVAGVTAETVRF